ncbi:MAG: hypothetical protein FJ146_18050 [Deltaproteobacteria bacterium]|nr:hypothetical protein [Deltaproteobacteria bacterium]
MLLALVLGCSGTSPMSPSGTKRATSTGAQGTSILSVSKSSDTEADNETNDSTDDTNGNDTTNGNTTGAGTDTGTTNNGINLAANVNCPATTDFTCSCVAAANGQEACEPAENTVGMWEHTGSIGTKTTTTNTATAQACPAIAQLGNDVFNVTCCYTNCGEFVRTVNALACARVDAKSFACR